MLQIDLCMEGIAVTRVGTQGRKDAREWVTRYQLTYSNSLNGGWQTSKVNARDRSIMFSSIYEGDYARSSADETGIGKRNTFCPHATSKLAHLLHSNAIKKIHAKRWLALLFVISGHALAATTPVGRLAVLHTVGGNRPDSFFRT